MVRSKGKTMEQKRKEIEELTLGLNEQVNSYFNTSEQMKEYLTFKSKFYQYSNRNTALINRQFPGAEAVGSFAFWKKKGFSVNKGEKGIKILKPTPFEYFYRDGNTKKIPVNKATDEEKKHILNKQIKINKDIFFSVSYVFDVSQTNATAKDLPSIFPNRWLEGEVKDYDLVYQSLEKIAENKGFAIVTPFEELGAAKGVCYPNLKQIALNPRNTELQNVKTLIHELAHASLHSGQNGERYSNNEKETQAELTAFTVSTYLGLDTSEYSLQYINHYSQNDIKDKIQLLDEVVQTSQNFIEIIERDLVENRTIINQRELEEPIVKIEHSDIPAIKESSVMAYSDFSRALHENQEFIKKPSNEIPEAFVNYQIIDFKGTEYASNSYIISKFDDIQVFDSLEQQILTQDRKLYDQLIDKKLIDNEEIKQTPVERLTQKYQKFQTLIQEENESPTSEEKIIRRLYAENDYFEEKESLLKANLINKETISVLEKGDSFNQQKHNDNKYRIQINKEIER